MNNSKNVTSAVFIIGQSLLLNVISIPATAYIVHRLGPYAYGQWAIATSLVAATGVLANFGLRTLFTRAIAQCPEKAAEGLAYQLGLRFLLTLAATVLALVFCVSMGYPHTVTVCVALSASALMCTNLANAFADIFQAFQLLKPLAMINLASGLILTFLSILVMWQGAGPVGLAISYIFGPLVCVASSALYVRLKLFRYGVSVNFGEYRRLLSDSRLLGAQQIVTMIRDRIEQLIVPKLVGIAGFGYFSAGLIPASRLVSVPDGFGTAFFPVISKAYARDKEEASNATLHLMVITTVICLPVTLLVTFFAGPIDQLLFPGKANTCRDVMQVTIWSLPLVGFIQGMAYGLQAAGRHEDTAKSYMRATVIGAVISVILIATAGVMGAAWSWILRAILVCLFMAPAFMRQFPKVLPRLPIGRIAAACAVMVVGLKLPMLSVMPHKSYMALGAVEATLAYVAVLFLLGVMNLLKQDAGQSKSEPKQSTSQPISIIETKPARVLYIGGGTPQRSSGSSTLDHPLPQALKESGLGVWIMDLSKFPLSPEGHYDLAKLRQSFQSSNGSDEDETMISASLLSYGKDIVASNQVSIIVTAGQDNESHAAAFALAARFGLPWVVDMRTAAEQSDPDPKTPMHIRGRTKERIGERGSVVLFDSDKELDRFLSDAPHGKERFIPITSWAACRDLDSLTNTQEDRALSDGHSILAILDALAGIGSGNCFAAWSKTAQVDRADLPLSSS